MLPEGAVYLLEIKMLNRDKRSKVLSMCFGDGCLHYIRSGGKLFGGLTIDHGLDQTDYITWKAQILREITGREINVRQGHRNKSVQISVCMKRFRCWRKHIYLNGKKDISRMLSFITDPNFLLAVWFMDDGYVAPNIFNGKISSIALRLYTCSETEETHKLIIQWFKDTFNVEPRIKYIKRSEIKKDPYLQFSLNDSFKLWVLMKDLVLQFPSMQFKFRHANNLYTSRFLQPPLNPIRVNDIVSASSNTGN
jgi:hypothetical protein